MPNFAAWTAWRRRRRMARGVAGVSPGVTIRPGSGSIVYTGGTAPIITAVDAGGPSGDAYLIETGDYLLLESGDFMLLE